MSAKAGRWIARLSLALLVLLAAGAGAVAWIVATPQGTRFALTRALPLLPQVTVQRIEGRLLDRLVLGALVVDTDGGRLAVERTEVLWRPRKLLAARVDIVELRAAGVRFVPATSAAPAEPGPPEYPPVPLPIDIGQLVLSDVTLVLPDGDQHLQRLALQARLDGERMTLEDIVLVAAPGELRGRIGIADGEVIAVAAELDFDGAAGAPARSASLAIAGRLDALHIEARIEAAAAARLSADLDVLADPPRGALEGEIEPLSVGEQAGPTRIGPTRIRARGSVQALEAEISTQLAAPRVAARTVSAELELRAHEADLAALEGSFEWRAVATAPAAFETLSGRGRFDFAGARLVLEHASAAPLPSTLEATLSALDSQPVLQATLALGPFELPLPERPAVALEQARVELDGTRAALAVTVRVQAHQEEFGALALALDGHLDDDSFAIGTLDIAALGGEVVVSGDIGFKPQPRAALAFDANGLEFARLDRRLESTVALAGQAHLEQVGETMHGRLDLARLSGDWRGYALAGRAQLEARGAQHIEVHEAHLTLGDNALELEGRFGREFDGRFSLDLPELGNFAPGLAGTLAGHGEFGGSRAQPALRATLEGRALRYAAWSAAQLEAAIDIDLGRSARQQIEVAVGELTHAETPLGRLTVRLDGVPGEHALEASLSGAERTAQLAAGGAWDAGVWSGRLAQLELGLGSFGAWSLRGPAQLRFGAGAVSATRTCLESGSALVCAEVAHWSAAAGSAELELERLDLGTFAEFLPTHVVLAGRLAAQASLSNAGGSLAATAVAAVDAGEVRLSRAGGELEVVPIPALLADIELTPERLIVDAAGEAGDWVAFDLGLRYGRGDEHALDGRLHLDATRLDWVEEFASGLAGTRGAAVVDATLSGTRGAPVVAFEARLAAGEVVVPASGLRLSTLTLKAHSEDARTLELEGRIGNAGGMLHLDGEVDTAAQGKGAGRLAIVGENFGAVRLPDIEADISPDLVLDFSAEHLDIGGRVVLPRVHVDLPSLPEAAVEVSSDEVLVSDADGAADGQNGDFFVDAVTGDVDIALGKDVRISAVGLEARLTGGLRWSKSRGAAVGRGAGRVSIAGGRYRAYGQRLVIERGHLTFAGPLDNPTLDVRAVRPDLDITAGVLVSGDVRSPRFELFSEPALPDSEVLSYIITGKGISDVTSGEGNAIARAALSLGAERSSMVTSQIAGAFGLDDLSVSAGQTARDTAFTATKQLTPKLELRSEFNPFDRLWSLFFNYELTPNWSVEAESGVRQGADLIYSIEREDLDLSRLLDPTRWFE